MNTTTIRIVDDLTPGQAYLRRIVDQRRRAHRRWALTLTAVAVLIGLVHLTAWATGNAPALDGMSYLSVLVMFIAAAILAVEPDGVLIEDVEARPWDEQQEAA